MDGQTRVFLLSLAAIPACGPEADDPSGSGDPARLRQSCEAFFGHLLACYGDERELGDKENDVLCGYYESSGQTYGPRCAAAMEDVFSCLAALDCEALTEDEDCDDRRVKGFEFCPELFSSCDSHSTDIDIDHPGRCSNTASECRNGKVYEVSCVPASDSLSTCTCVIDGKPMSTSTVDAAICDPENDGRGQLITTAERECGFPESAF